MYKARKWEDLFRTANVPTSVGRFENSIPVTPCLNVTTNSRHCLTAYALSWAHVIFLQLYIQLGLLLFFHLKQHSQAAKNKQIGTVVGGGGG
jgi:hypothetical protein